MKPRSRRASGFVPEKCYQIIGLKIRNARIAAGLSQYELSDLTKNEIHRTHISQWETGYQRIWPHQVEQIAKALKLPVDYFFTGVWK